MAKRRKFSTADKESVVQRVFGFLEIYLIPTESKFYYYLLLAS